MVALWKDGLAERVEVQPLGRSEVDELVTAGLGGQVDGTTLRDLWQLTRGNPMFLRELDPGRVGQRRAVPGGRCVAVGGDQ